MGRSVRVSGWVKSLATVSVLAALAAGCASPRYQTVKRHAPPEGAAGQACLDKCAAAMGPCKRECEARYQSCTKSVLPDAQARHDQMLRHYEAALSMYRWELERYRMDLMLGSGHGYPYGLWGWHHPFPPPVPPLAPSLEREAKKLSQERCDRDCGCQTTYDSCFLGCGGKIESQTLCIAHCPPPKP